MWRSLGTARQITVYLLLTLMLLQAILLIISEKALFLPLVAMVALIGVVLLKLSASTRDSNERTLDIRRGLLRLHQNTTRTRGEIERAHQDIVHENDTVRKLLIQQQMRQRALRDERRFIREQMNQVVTGIKSLTDHAETSRLQLEMLATKSVDTAALIGAQGQMFTDARQWADAAVSEQVASANELSRLVRSIHGRLKRALDAGDSHSLERRLVAELSALALLHSPKDWHGLPPFASWAMAPLAVQFVQSVADKLSPDATVVELGSGVSTAWLGFGLSRKANAPRLIAIDHDPKYAAVTRQYLLDIGANANAEVVLAPLAPVTVNGVTQEWYGTEWIDNVHKIGLLVVDGPPAGTNTAARYPALPLLVERLADQATILLDDAARPGESDVVSSWLEIPGVSQAGFVGRSLILNFSRVNDSTR